MPVLYEYRAVASSSRKRLRSNPIIGSSLRKHSGRRPKTGAYIRGNPDPILYEPELPCKILRIGRFRSSWFGQYDYGGLRRNRELSIVVSSSDEKFDDIPALFDELWEDAATFTPDALEKFSSWQRNLPVTTLPPMTGIPHAEPRTINVATHKKTRERVHLQTFHRYYYETLIPNHRLVESCFAVPGSRHPAYADFDLEYEIEAFLSWVRLRFTTEENYWTFPIRKKDDILANVREHVGKWIAAEDTPSLERLDRMAKLKKIFSEPDTLEAVSLSELADALTGCAAFEEQLRFTLGGRASMLEQFQRENSLETVRACFGHLAFGSDEFVKRIYDCIFSSEYKIRHFGRSCILELFGWINREDIPPFNNRAIKSLRYLGCDVKP
jgi:hypothetical protein